jgi:hypothetical protein
LTDGLILFFNSFIYLTCFFLQLVLFGEIVLAQKIMYERFGGDFIVNFIAKGLSGVHCPPDLAEQYYQKLKVCYFSL